MDKEKFPTKKSSAKYTLPLNWSEKYIEFVYENSEHIESVYGSLPGYPGGRPVPHTSGAEIEGINHKRLAYIIDRLKSKGIDFHFVYNMSCTGNVYLTKRSQEKFAREVNELYDIGIREVIVSNFGLARIISKINPDIKINMSVILNITEPDQLLYLKQQDFNCKGLVIGKGLTRNLPKLHNFIELSENMGLTTAVIANDFCPAPNCPERISDHNNACAHKHLPFDSELGKQRYISPSTYCKKLVMNDPSLYLKAPIINPNDIEKYEDIGVKLIKLTDRVMPDEQLIAICRAYFNKEYDGNYFELFSYTSDFGKAKKGNKELSKDEILNILDKGYDELREHRSSFIYRPYASAKALSNSKFMNLFKKGKCDNSCFHKTLNPKGCKHCSKHTERFVTIDKDAAAIVAKNINYLIDCVTAFPKEAR